MGLVDSFLGDFVSQSLGLGLAFTILYPQHWRLVYVIIMLQKIYKKPELNTEQCNHESPNFMPLLQLIKNMSPHAYCKCKVFVAVLHLKLF